MTDANTPTRQQHMAEDEIDLTQLVATLWDHKWIIIGVTALVTTLGVLYALLATPVYQADALLQVEKKQGSLPLFGDAGDFFMGDSSAQTEIEIARSRMVLTQAIEQVQADISVKPQPRNLKERFLPGLFANSNRLPFAGWSDADVTLWVDELLVPASYLDVPLTLTVTSPNTYTLSHDDEPLLEGTVGSTANNDKLALSLKVKQLDAPEGFTFTLSKRSFVKALQSTRSSLNITESGKQTGILRFTYTGTNRDSIATILDAIATSYFVQNIQRRAEEAEKSLNFLQEQMPEIRTQLTEAEEKLSAHRLKSESVDLSMEAQALLTQIVQIEAKINDLAIRESEVASLYTREHPTYKTIQRQRHSLIKEKERLQQEVQNMPETQQEILRLTRDVELNQEIYLQLQNRDQELRILKAGTVGNVRIIDDAQVQPNRIKPKRSLIVLISGMLGGMLGVGLVLLKAMLNRGIQSPEELEQEGISVYASLPLSPDAQEQDARWERQQRRRNGDVLRDILSLTHPADLSIEALRSLRTSLHFATMDARNNIIAFSGPSPGVGKTFVCTNLAVVLAQTGKKVLLIDADLRRGRLHASFAADHSKGLSGYLAGSYGFDEAVHHTKIDGLDVMFRGTVPPNPSELLMHERFDELLDNVNDEYDIVIVDTPPILAVTDAAIVGQHAATTLMVARYGVSSLKEVEHALLRFERNNVVVKGIVLNAIEQTASNAYQYYQYEYK